MWPDIGGRWDCRRVTAFPPTWTLTWPAVEVCFVPTPRALSIGSYRFLQLLKSDAILPTADAALVQPALEAKVRTALCKSPDSRAKNKGNGIASLLLTQAYVLPRAHSYAVQTARSPQTLCPSTLRPFLSASMPPSHSSLPLDTL